MKTLLTATFLVALFASAADQSHTPLSAADTTMNHETALTTYVEMLDTHSWEQIAPCVTEEAVLLFTEDTP